MELDLNTVYAEYAETPSEYNLENVMRAGERMVRSLVHSLSHGPISDDLMQAGYVGLMQAVNRYDPEKEAAFATYAYHWIMGEIRLEIRKERTFERPLWMVKLQDEILKVTEAFIQKEQRAPTRAELAKILNIDEAGIAEAMQAGHVPLEDLELSTLRSSEPKNFQLPLEDKLALQQALRVLSDLQRAVINAIFFQGKSQQEVGDELNLSRSQVHRSLKKSMEILGKMLKS